MTMPALDDDDFSELIDFRPDRVDLIGRGANGVPRFLIAKEDASAGLLPPEFVRGLVAKATPEREEDDMVTVKGSSAAIAKMMHQAALRAQARQPGSEDQGVRVLKMRRDGMSYTQIGAELGMGTAAAYDTVAKAIYEMVCKAKYNADDLKRMAGNGQAMNDEAYPIADEEDLHNAIHAVGRGGADHDAIRRHVIARAKALGKSSMIPDNWAADGSLKQKVSKDMADIGPELDEGVDGMDPTVVLAAPEEMGPGDPTEPASPAWESIDAATACKWTQILARARVAIDTLAEREMLEAAAGDSDDAEKACELQDVCCALDFAISVLAPFAVSEQSAADVGAEEMAAIGKAADQAVEPLGVIEAFVAIRKAGRVLSAANEGRIRDAAASLQQVLASLPQAPVESGQPVAKQKGADMDGTDTAAGVAKETASADDQARDTGPVTAGGTTGLGEPRKTGPAEALPGDGPQDQLPGDAPGRTVIKAAAGLQVLVYDRAGVMCRVDPAAISTRIEKADGDGDGDAKKLQAVFDQNGDLIGVVDPDAIQPVAGAGGSQPDDTDGDDGTQDAAAAAAPGADDMQPQPAGNAGTPAEDVTKSGNITLTRDELADIAKQAAEAALATQEAAHQGVVAKMAADNGELAKKVEALEGRLETVEKSDAPSKVFTNGATPPAGARPQLRGQDQGAQVVDVAKAAVLRKTLTEGNGPEQAAAFNEMQQMAVEQLAQIRAGAVRSPAVSS